MSREIRFRVWDRKNGKMLLPLTRMIVYENAIGEGVSVMFPVSCEGNYVPTEADSVVEQFIGLKDSAGVDIYEGDILSFDIHGATHGREREEGMIEPVWYSNEDAQFVFGKHVVPEATNERGFKTGGYTWWYSMVDDVDKATLQVLGNIHEHPHLIKS